LFTAPTVKPTSITAVATAGTREGIMKEKIGEVQKLTKRYSELNWTIKFYNDQHDFDAAERINAMDEQNFILSRLYEIVQYAASQIVDLRTETDDASNYIGRAAYFVSVTDGTILTGTVTKNKKNKIVIVFEQGNTSVGSILYLAD
jgi:ribosomal protein L35AE/L33A